MIIYSDLEYETTFKDFIRKIDKNISCARANALGNHDSLRDLFINFGEFHNSAADKIFYKEDYNHPIITRFSQAEIYLAKVLLSSWMKKRKDIEQEFDSFIKLYEKISENEIEGKMRSKISEGFAFYAYYPEAFFLSAEKFFNDCKPDEVYCIGIRSIGTSLSAAAAAMLEHKGCISHLLTFRTRGDFENRSLSVNKSWLDKITSNKNLYYLIIDEGPGLSGSSFGVTSALLSDAGIPNEKIIFISTWNPSPENLSSHEGKTKWGKHSKYYTTFEELWIESGRLKETFNYQELTDLSSGKWIKTFTANEEIPADPSEERKKFLLKKENETNIIKFTGLGNNGANIYKRLNILYQNEFIPEIKSFREGFVEYQYVPGYILTKDYRDNGFFSFASRYFSFLQNNFPSSQNKNNEQIFNMIYENCAELMEGRIKEMLIIKKELFLDNILSDACYIDGNVLPYKWLRTNSGYYKLDSGEHASDHMFPGCQNILWDIAAFILEFNLNEKEQQDFVNHFENEEESFNKSLPYYTIAYSAFKMAYCSVKSDVRKKSDLGKLFLKYKNFYMGTISENLKKI